VPTKVDDRLVPRHVDLRPVRGQRRGWPGAATTTTSRRSRAGDVDRALRHYTAEAQRARAEGDRIRLVWTRYSGGTASALDVTVDMTRLAWSRPTVES